MKDIKPTYSSIHNWLRRTYPKLGVCQLCHKKRKTEYALKKGKTHKKDISRYSEMCIACHRVYDGKIELLKVANKTGKWKNLKRRKQWKRNLRKSWEGKETRTTRIAKMGKGLIKMRNSPTKRKKWIESLKKAWTPERKARLIKRNKKYGK